jgi:DNA-binding response OmpR family regulator
MTRGLKLRILFVEDEADIRETLAEILQLHDYEVVAVETAEAGLKELEREPFDLLLTDYNLPGEPGVWLIEEARARGLLGEMAAAIVSAHTSPRVAPDVTLMRKPLNIDHFLGTVQQLLGPAAARKLAEGKARVATERRPQTAALPPVEFTLYVSPQSPSSLRALRNLQALLERFPGLPVVLTVRDLSLPESLAEAEIDRIAFTPTLVKKSPGARSWILGTLDNVRPVLDQLEIAGLIPAHTPG